MAPPLRRTAAAVRLLIALPLLSDAISAPDWFRGAGDATAPPHGGRGGAFLPAPASRTPPTAGSAPGSAGAARLSPASDGGGGDGKSPPSPLFSPGYTSASARDLPPGFNPFDRSPLSSERRIDSPGRLSLRKMRMRGVTSDLLRSANDPEAMRRILEENEEFLCEQLVDLEAPLDEDSIYTPEMGLEERRDRYREEMEDRLGRSTDGNVRRVLVAMRDWVLGYEDRRRDVGGE